VRIVTVPYYCTVIKWCIFAGLGAVASRALRVTDNMIYAAAKAVADIVTPDQVRGATDWHFMLLLPFDRSPARRWLKGWFCRACGK
jgi:hypothetical protein